MKKLLIMILLSLFISCDSGLDQNNKSILGRWEFNSSEYIDFKSDDIFIMNDSIQGGYEMDNENDKDIFYYYISVSEQTEGYGYMHIVDHEKNMMTISNLPLHEGETIEMIHR